MKTINKNSACRHRWRVLGSHTLHVGDYIYRGKPLPRAVQREVRVVKMCTQAGCGELRVNIRKEIVHGVEPGSDHMYAVRHQHQRVPGQTAVGTLRRKKGSKK